ncbi:alpha-amylase [Nocardioides agariphilus]|uniref:Alpha-amylase n=1 Tax=Nocardioides agariphilus TaxID=433664 RepID=A0A930VHZ4_9ACTN|nr:alpha-amylase [Nocardioides agariphilus]
MLSSVRPPSEFETRVERWRHDLVGSLERLYDDPVDVAQRLLAIARNAYDARPDELHDLDQRRLDEPDWFQRSSALGYAAYVDRFGATLKGVAEHLDHLSGLGVTYLHLMPLLTPRPAPNDGGYAVADYTTVREDLGSNEDLRDLAAALRERGISLCIDLVLNHTAREHAWAAAARAGDAEKRDYYLVYPDRHLPDQYEQSLPEVFPDFAPGNFTWDDELEAWVWTTFNDYQWDLNWANPSVLCEFAEILLGWANAGIEVFRLDAIAFLWKRMGTNCQNQPEVHHLTQALRTVARIAAPAVLFKAEAIVGPADLAAYLGTGAHAGKVCDLAYHNSLMVQVWSMLASGEVGLAALALQNLPQPPPTTSWITYLRCHDDIGWAIDDTDAWRAGLNGHAHRRFLADWYAGSFPGSWARGLVFQENHQTGDRRISGSLASLAGRQADDPAATARILLAHSVILSFGGLPVIWMGDEVGLLNDLGWADDPAHAADNRWAHRPRMPWPVPEDTDGIREGLDHLLHVRASLPHLHAASPTEVWDPRDPGVLLVVRRSPHGPLLAAANMTDRAAHVPSEVFYWLGMAGGELVDHLTGDRPRFDGDSIALGPYAAAWLTAEHGNT